MPDETPEAGESGNHTFRSSMSIRAATLSTKDRATLLSLAKDRALDADALDEEGNEPFFWTARASNQNIDSYFTRMDESSLNNYANDATDPGVQFQNSHNGASFLSGGEVGFGRSLQGKVTGRSGAKEVLIDFYAIPGLQCGNMTSDQFIRGTRAGIYADVSIGFVPGQMICSICGNDWLKRYDWFFFDLDDDEESCRHWPGKEYEVGEGSKKKKVRCILDVMNGRLSEVSTVYDGATPGAGIAAVDMARMMSAEGKLSEPDRAFVENLYRVRIAPPPGVYGGVAVEYSTRGTTMTKKETEDRDAAEVVEETTAEVEDTTADDDGGRIALGKKPETVVAESADPLERLRQKYDGTGITIGSDPYKMIERLADHCLSQAGEIDKLTQEAGYGRQARDAKLTELDGTVVRAFGAEGADNRQALHRKAVASMDMGELQSYIDDLEGRAKTRIPGGQITRTEASPNGDEETAVVDDNHTPRGKTPAKLVY